MKTLLKLALRNLRRQFKRNRFSIASIALGLAVLFWLQSIFHGHNRNMVEIATTTFTGNLQVYAEGYLEDHSVTLSFVPGPVVAALSDRSDLVFTPRVQFPAIVSSSDDSTPTLLYGIDPESESRITTLKQNLKEGEYLASDGGTCTEKKVYLGSVLAKKLRVGLGNKIVVMGQAADGTLGNDLFRISGIFDSGSPEFDKTHVFTTLACAADIAAMQGKVHEVIVKTDTGDRELTLQSMLQNKFNAENLGVKVTTWREVVPSLSTMIRVNNGMMTMITFTFFFVITLGTINAMLMNVFERTREFGVMLSLGAMPAQVRTLLVFESAFMGVVAAFIGTVIGSIAVGYHARFGFDIGPFLGKNGTSFVGFKFRSMVYPTFEWVPYLKLVSLELLFIVIAGFYPAHRAAGLDPVETLRS